MARRALVAVALCAGALFAGCSDEGGENGVSFVQREGSRLVKVQTVGLAAFGPINPQTADPSHAALAFGEPSAVERRGGACRHRWVGLGLAIDFDAAGGTDRCEEEGGIERIRVRGPAAAQAGWRTAEGIRPGMPVAAVRRIYPEGHRGTGLLVLVEPLAGAGAAEVGPVLAVTTAHGRVDGLTFAIGAPSR